MDQLLSGITVVEIGEGFAACFAGKMLADLGADVVKVEAPTGDPSRWDYRAPESPDGTRRSGSLLQLNANKRSVVLDPGEPDDQARLSALLADVDLVFESLPTATLARYGVEWAPQQSRYCRRGCACRFPD